MRRLAAVVLMLLVPVLGWSAVDDSYTVSLLHFDSGLADESGRTWGAIGTPVVTAAEAKFGAGSLSLDGASAMIASISSDFDLATGDYTLDLWAKFTVSPAAVSLLGSHEPGMWADVLMGTGGGAFGALENGGLVCSIASIPATGTWTHFALVRYSGTTTIYISGVTVASGASLSDIVNTRPFSIGGTYTGVQFGTGYVDEVRISKGIARWTSDFTPPTSAYGPAVVTPRGILALAPGGSVQFGLGSTVSSGLDDSMTMALLHLDGDSVDQAGHSFSGMGAWSYSSGKFGSGAGHSDGITSYLSAPDGDDWYWPGSWTVDAWVRPTSVGDGPGTNLSYLTIWSQGFGAATGHWLALRNCVDYGPQLVYAATWEPFACAGTISVATSTWSHYAASNDGTTIRLFQDGGQIATMTVAGSPSNIATTALSLRGYLGVGAFAWAADIDELRASKGVARWVADFSVPTAAYGSTRSVGASISLR